MNLLLRMYLLQIESIPEKIIIAEAKVGIKAHHPGYKFASFKKYDAPMMIKRPKSESALA